MAACIVAIGRNVDDEPMPSHTWASFKGRVFSEVNYFSKEIFCTADGWSAAGSRWGMEEETYIISADVGDGYQTALNFRLAELAEKYRQDAIAVTWGKTTLVGPDMVD